MFKKEKSLQTGPGHKAPIRGGGGGVEAPPKIVKKVPIRSIFISRFHILFPTFKKAPKLYIETIEVRPN